MTIKSALLNEQGIFLRVEALDDESQLTAQHVPSITECDLPPGRYRWVPCEPQSGNPFGGEFRPIPMIEG